jgi:hypothetical protein
LTEFIDGFRDRGPMSFDRRDDRWSSFDRRRDRGISLGLDRSLRLHFSEGNWPRLGFSL